MLTGQEGSHLGKAPAETMEAKAKCVHFELSSSNRSPYMMPTKARKLPSQEEAQGKKRAHALFGNVMLPFRRLLLYALQRKNHVIFGAVFPNSFYCTKFFLYGFHWRTHVPHI